jgi:hypothetical protein
VTRPARFTKTDVSRAMTGARQAGYTRVRVGIDVNGNIVIDASDESPTIEPDRRNPLDRLLTRA